MKVVLQVSYLFVAFILLFLAQQGVHVCSELTDLKPSTHARSCWLGWAGATRYTSCRHLAGHDINSCHTPCPVLLKEDLGVWSRRGVFEALKSCSCSQERSRSHPRLDETWPVSSLHNLWSRYGQKVRASELDTLYLNSRFRL